MYHDPLSTRLSAYERTSNYHVAVHIMLTIQQDEINSAFSLLSGLNWPSSGYQNTTRSNMLGRRVGCPNLSAFLMNSNMFINEFVRM